MRHKLTNIDTEARVANCSVCGLTNIISRGQGSQGRSRWRCGKAVAAGCRKARDRKDRYDLKETCERCGFEPEDSCQLDIHHIDSNRKNNAPENRQTLCANCHRLFSKKQKMRKSKYDLLISSYTNMQD